MRVGFENQSKTAIAGSDSLWRVVLEPLKASSTPQTITISSATSTLLLSNILICEVWLASGQSNMEYPMNGTWYAKPLRGIDSAKIALQEKHEGIRVLNVKRKTGEPDIITEGWHDCEGPDFGMTSVAAFYFAKQLEASLKVPVGIITSAWGGTRIEDWTPISAYKGIPVLFK
ncbi:sialate O-acetylesterase [Pedobacter sp. P351]|uniref:sialate O-acetylesterase n=1 Tax=Pedobacter superstes TaxID=3133441 RepID=UPI0030996022